MVYLLLLMSMVAIGMGVMLREEATAEEALAIAAICALLAIAVAIYERRS